MHQIFEIVFFKNQNHLRKMAKNKKTTNAAARKTAEAKKAQKKQVRDAQKKDAVPQQTKGKKGPSLIKNSKTKKK